MTNLTQITDEMIDKDPLAVLERLLVIAQRINTIEVWDSEQASKTYQEYLANLDKYDGKLITASKAYFNEYLNGKVVNTKIGLVRINSKSRGKVHDRMRDVKYLAIPYIPEVLMTGDVGDLVPLNKERDDSAVGYYEFKKSKILENYTLNITLKVALDSDGNLLYYLGASKEKANLRTISHARSTTGSKVGFDSITSHDDDEINIEVQVLDKDGNVLTEEEAEKLLFGDGEKPKSSTSILKGRTNNVKTAKGTKVSTIFALVEADDVIASHTATGAKNPQYPQELQPRDREREASTAWVAKVSNDLDPDSLGRSGRADTGAPITGDDLVVESGNGRTMAIKLAYQNGKADEYKEFLIDEADYFGFAPEQVEAFEQPILIRIRTTDIDRVQFAIEANQDDKLSYSATERAKTDAKRLDENLLQLFMPSDDGDLLAASNQKFIQGFLRKLGDTESAQYITKDGKPTQALVSRIKAAVFSKAYDDDRLLEMMADQTKPDLQNMLNALSVAAPKFIEAQSVSRGDVADVSSHIVDGIEQALDKQVSNAIIDATNVILKAKRDNQDIKEFVKQQGLFEDLPDGVADIAVFLASNARSAKKMSLFFKTMAEFVEKQAIDGQNIGLFGEPEPLSVVDVVQYAISIVEDNSTQSTMFDAVNIDLPTDDDINADPLQALERLLQIAQQQQLDKAVKDGFTPIEQWTDEDSQKATSIFAKYLKENSDDYLKAAKEYFVKELQGKKIKTRIGLVSVNSKSKGKMLHRLRHSSAMIIPYIPEILLLGNVGEREELNKERKDDFVAFYTFEKTVTVNEVAITARIKVGELHSGLLAYYLAAKKEAPYFDASWVDDESKTRGVGRKLNFDSITPQDEDNINIEIVKIIDLTTGKEITEEEAERLLNPTDNGRFEYVIWGIPQNGKYEELLVAKVENKAITSREDAERICDVLKVKHGVTNTRIQVVDLGGGFGVNDFGDAQFDSIIDDKAQEACTSKYNDLHVPTEKQTISGNYKKGHLTILGLGIAIENPADSIRKGIDSDGNHWQSKMKHHYGYIKNTLGADGDEVDVFIKKGLDNDFNGDIFVIYQVNKDGSFDEHKVVIGAKSISEAKAIYLDNYEDGWQGIGSIKKYSLDKFKDKFIGRKSFDSIHNLPTDEQINADPLAVLERLLVIMQQVEASKAKVSHTTKKGKTLDGVVIQNIDINQAKDFDPYAFKKDGGIFIRLRDLAKVPDNLLTDAQIALKNQQGGQNVQYPSGSITPTQPLRDNGLSQAANSNDPRADLGMARGGRDEDRGSLRGHGSPSLSESVLSSDGGGSNQSTDSGQARDGQMDSPDVGRGSGRSGSTRTSTQRGRDRQLVSRATVSAKRLTLKEQEQLNAEGTPTEWGAKENIDHALPFLMPEQCDDVVKAETRLIEQNENGILFTNGTGTGKTFTGLGLAKRFANAEMKNILIVTLNDKIVNDFVKSSNPLRLKAYKLEDTKDNGGDEHNVVVTTYANFGANQSLFKKQWDLLVMDESHTLSQGSDGKATAALKKLRALTGHHSAFEDYFEGTYSDDEQFLGREERDENNDLTEKAKSINDKWHDFKYQQRQKYNLSYRNKSGKRTKVIFLSATPFSYHFSLDWAEGYLFDYIKPEQKFDENGDLNLDNRELSYNHGDAKEQFFMQKLGYRMRTNKLTRPDGDVDSGVLERNFAEELKKTGAMSGRELVVNFDYDRKFVMIQSKAGQLIDEGLAFLSNTKDMNLSESTEAFYRKTNSYNVLSAVVQKRFDYLTRRKLLEAIKADAAIDQAKKHISLGRKVVIFHDYNEGGGFSPFKFVKFEGDKADELRSQYQQFKKERPDLVNLDLNYNSPIEQVKQAFPNALLFNGRVSKGQREKNAELFNTDKNGYNVIILQSDAGSTGISLHDTTGVHQRVLINIGQPTKPAKLRQTEGRIYRTGQASNAIQRYLTTGTSWERAAFASTIAGRAETVDNFAKGDDALVSIKEALIQAYEEAEYSEPSLTDGVGGKAYDEENARISQLSPFDKAMTYYNMKGKNNKSRDNREGTDWYATPEPLGYKMVEWAGVHIGDSVLEPSAGDGAIGRFVPNDASLTMIEPSEDLASRAQMANSGAKILNESFENHDTSNKYHAVVMNPPFGRAGSTAIKHLKQAFAHLYDGGRVVALIPNGAMDSKVEQWLSDEPNAYLYAEIKLPTVTFERAGTKVSTRIIIIEKHENDTSHRYGRNFDLSSIDNIKDLFARIENIEQPPRINRIDEDLEKYGLHIRTERSKYILGGNGLNNPILKKLLKSAYYPDENEFGELVYRYNRSRAIVKLIKEYEDENDVKLFDSASAIKSVDANIKRGTQAMNKALTDKTTVHRAMYRNDIGWIDFEYGSDKQGIKHIIERRIDNDNMTYQEVVKMLTIDIVETIAKGITQRKTERGLSARLNVAYDNHEASLIKRKGSNAWLLTAFKSY